MNEKKSIIKNPIIWVVIVALLLCVFLGFLGAHKFYEGKIGMGIIYILTGGLFLIGVIIDFIVLLFKPITYYV